MTVRSKLSPLCVDAVYKPSRLPHYAGNPLIEALPAALEPDEVLQLLSVSPPFQAEQRAWTTAERIQMLKTLAGFLTPLVRHLPLFARLDSLLRSGLVGRQPGTPEYAQRQQRIYEGRQNGQWADWATDELDELQEAMLLMGVSGMGKSRLLKLWARTLPRVIYHPEFNTYQIPVLHLEMPSNGASVAGLCNGIFRAVDKLVPGCNYLENYALKGKPSVETLIQRAAGVLNRHCVGIVIGDEIQNLVNAGKAKQVVMTELVSLSNVLNLPLVFLGTNKAASLFGLDFRESRRVSGFGGEHWDRLDEGTFCVNSEETTSEWQGFVSVLWQYQWTRQPVELTAKLSSLLYWCSQGVIDTAIKLFVAAQARAMLDGTETVTVELLQDVYDREFQLLHPMMDALRSDDYEALAKFDDIRPISMNSLLDSMNRRGTAATSQAYAMKPTTEGFVAQVATALMAAGFQATESVAAADEVGKEGKARNLLHAIELATAKLKPPKRTSGSKSSKGKQVAEEVVDYSERPQDYRYAMQLAKEAGTPVLEQLRAQGAVRPVAELLMA